MGKNTTHMALIPCKVGTYFCVCNDCGRSYVISPKLVDSYMNKGHVVPTVRCKECIIERRAFKNSKMTLSEMEAMY